LPLQEKDRRKLKEGAGVQAQGDVHQGGGSRRRQMVSILRVSTSCDVPWLDAQGSRVLGLGICGGEEYIRKACPRRCFILGSSTREEHDCSGWYCAQKYTHTSIIGRLWMWIRMWIWTRALSRSVQLMQGARGKAWPDGTDGELRARPSPRTGLEEMGASRRAEKGNCS
jgi:hypothetical protein